MLRGQETFCRQGCAHSSSHQCGQPTQPPARREKQQLAHDLLSTPGDVAARLLELILPRSSLLTDTAVLTLSLLCRVRCLKWPRTGAPPQLCSISSLCAPPQLCEVSPAACARVASALLKCRDIKCARAAACLTDSSEFSSSPPPRTGSSCARTSSAERRCGLRKSSPCASFAWRGTYALAADHARDLRCVGVQPTGAERDRKACGVRASPRTQLGRGLLMY